MNTPILETKRLLLRPFCAGDFHDVFECWESDPDIARYMFWSSHNDIEKTEKWLEYEIGQIPSDTWFRWAVTDKETGTLFGTCLIYYEPEYNLFEVSYNLGKRYWGQGFTTEAMRKIISFAKNTLKVKELVGRSAKENPSSGNVMRKLGFRYSKDIPYEANEGKVHYDGMEYRLLL